MANFGKHDIKLAEGVTLGFHFYSYHNKTVTANITIAHGALDENGKEYSPQDMAVKAFRLVSEMDSITAHIQKGTEFEETSPRNIESFNVTKVGKMRDTDVKYEVRGDFEFIKKSALYGIKKLPRAFRADGISISGEEFAAMMKARSNEAERARKLKGKMDRLQKEKDTLQLREEMVAWVRKNFSKPTIVDGIPKEDPADGLIRLINDSERGELQRLLSYLGKKEIDRPTEYETCEWCLSPNEDPSFHVCPPCLEEREQEK